MQGITHLIAKVLVRMEPLPTRMTTASFDLLMQATEMVRYDAPGVFFAIERLNPFAAEVRERFFALAARARSELEFDNEPDQAEALLRFLRSVAQEHIVRTLDTPDRVKAFEEGSERLRVALRKAHDSPIG